MMKKIARLTAVASLVMAATASPAQAAVNNVFTNVCGGSSFGTCASATISTLYSGGNTVVTVQFWNTGTLGDIFTAFGLHSFPIGTQTFAGGQFSGPAGWSLATTGSGLGNLTDLKFIANTNGVNSGIANGGSATFSFTLAGDFSQYNFDDWGVHSQAGPNGCSTKLIVTGGTANTPSGVDDTGAPCASSSVPEPATMVLLGTGLVGVFGGAAARRRRQG